MLAEVTPAIRARHRPSIRGRKPSPDIPEETPPYEKDPETPPVEPEPELPPVEPIVPEVEPLPGEEPGIPAFK